MLSVRPKIAELMFQVYGRALHPELFEIFATRTVSRGDYEATIRITSAGHVVAWRYRGLTLTEVACSASHPLPQKRRLLHYRLKGHRSDELECRGGVRYEMNFQLEPVEAGGVLDISKGIEQRRHPPGHATSLRFQRTDGAGRAKLCERGSAQSEPYHSGFSHLSRRLRHREKPIGVCRTVGH